MYIDIATLKSEGFAVTVEEDTKGIIKGLRIQPVKGRFFNWDPMQSQFYECGIPESIINDALDQFMRTIHLEQIFMIIRHTDDNGHEI